MVAQVRDTFVEWTDSAVKEAQVASGEPVAAGTAKAAAVDLEKWSDGDRPSFIYWMWSDEADPRGKESKRANRGLWDNEQVARAARLFTCYRVDAKDVPARTLARYGVTVLPSVTVVGKDRVPLAVCPCESAGGMVNFLYGAAKKYFPDYWRSVVARMVELAKKYEEGRAAMAKKDWDAAIAAFTEIYNDNVRADVFDKARDLLQQARAKLQKQTAKNN